MLEFHSAASPEMARSILKLFNATLDEKGGTYVMPSPAVMAELLPGIPQDVIHAMCLTGLYQGEGCVSPSRPSETSKWPFILISSESAPAMFAELAYDTQLQGVRGGSVRVTQREKGTGRSVGGEALGGDEESGDEQENGPRMKASVEAQSARIGLLLDEITEEGLPSQLARLVSEWKECVEEKELQLGDEHQAATWAEERHVGGESRVVWTLGLAKRLAKDVACEFAIERPASYRRLMRVVIRRLAAAYRATVPAGVETDKLHYTLVFHAKADVSALIPTIIMGTRLNTGVRRKLDTLAGWGTECREVGKGESDSLSAFQ